MRKAILLLILLSLFALAASCVTATSEISTICENDNISIDNKIDNNSLMSVTTFITIDLSKDINDVSRFGDIQFYNIQDKITSDYNFNWLQSITIFIVDSNNYYLIVDRQLSDDEKNSSTITFVPYSNDYIISLFKKGPVKLQITAVGYIYQFSTVTNSLCASAVINTNKTI